MTFLRGSDNGQIWQSLVCCDSIQQLLLEVALSPHDHIRIQTYTEEEQMWDAIGDMLEGLPNES